METTDKPSRKPEKSWKSRSGAATSRGRRKPASDDRALELLTKIMLDSAPLICAIWDEAGQLIDCNKEMLRQLKVKDKADVAKHFFCFSPERQPNGQLSREKGTYLIKEALKTGHQHFEWEYLTTDNERLPTETSLIRVEWKNTLRIFSYSRNLRELEKEKEQKILEKARITTILNTQPLATYLVSDKFQLIDCNEAALHLFNANDKEHVITSVFEDFSPQYQPDGEPSKEKAREYMAQAFLEGRVDFEWNHQSSDGEIIPTRIALIRIPWNRNGYVLSTYVEDLREMKKAEREIWQQAVFLRIVNEVAEQLLSTNLKNADEQIEKSMEFLARNMTLDGIKVWMNYEQNEELYYRLYKSWPATDALLWPAGYAYNHVPFWKDSMLDGHPINSFVSDLPKAEQTLLLKQGIKSVLAIPLFIENELWGYLSYEDRLEERVFTDSEEQMLRSAGSLIASNIVRNHAIGQMEKNNRDLRRKSHLLSSVNLVAELILGSEKTDFPLVVQRALKLLGESVGANRASLWINHTSENGMLYGKRLPGWKRGETFSKTMHSKEMKVLEYTPEWDVPVNKLRDLEYSASEMNEHMKKLTVLQGSKTLLLIPLVLQEKFWGFVGFAFESDSHRSTEEDRSILRSSSMMIVEAMMRQEISETLEKVEENASTDNLTGLLTRAAFMKRASSLFRENQARGTSYSVLFLDIDHFKMVNDQHGHAFGDKVLMHFSEILGKITRPSDLCCRYGGEEIVITLANSELPIAQRVAERILYEVRTSVFESNKDFHYTVSIGIFSNVPEENENLLAYIEKADLALYTAKRMGRNQIINYVDIPGASITAAPEP